MALTFIDSRTLHIRVADASSRQELLDAALGRLVRTAVAEGKCGILLTRHSSTFYSAVLSEYVPYGRTYETTSETYDEKDPYRTDRRA